MIMGPIGPQFERICAGEALSSKCVKEELSQHWSCEEEGRSTSYQAPVTRLILGSSDFKFRLLASSSDGDVLVT